MDIKQCWNCRVDNVPSAPVCYNCSADLRMSHVEREGDPITPVVIGIVLLLLLFITFTVTTPGLIEQYSPETHFLKLSSWDWKQSDAKNGKAEGAFLNSTPMTYSDVSVRVDFMDEAGNPVGFFSSELKPSVLKEDHRRSFTIPFPWKNEIAHATLSLRTPAGDQIRFLK